VKIALRHLLKWKKKKKINETQHTIKFNTKTLKK
jgi:hypothetical protein